MPCLVRNSGVWPLISCVSALVLQNTRLAECVIFRMEDMGSVTITLHLRHRIKFSLRQTFAGSNYAYPVFIRYTF